MEGITVHKLTCSMDYPDIQGITEKTGTNSEKKSFKKVSLEENNKQKL